MSDTALGFVRVTEKANEWNHPAGMWWDDHIGEEFRVRQIHDGIPGAYEVDVSHLDMPGGSRIAYILKTYAEPV